MQWKRNSQSHPRVHSAWIPVACLASALWVAGCESETVAGGARQPFDALPDGACMALVSSDLAGVWGRVRGHEAVRAFRALLPYLRTLDAPEVKRLLESLDSFQQRSGTRVHEDLLLNVFGRRVAIGVYPQGNRTEVLCVSELQDAGRFDRILEAIQREGHASLSFTKTQLDGREALEIRDTEGKLDTPWLAVHDEHVLVLTNSAALARRAWRIQAHESEPTALAGDAFQEGLAALGPVDIAVLEQRDASDRVRWAAQGLTWDTDGLHFRRTLRVPPPEEEMPLETPVRRDEILRSFPRGMTLAYYARPTDAALLLELFGGIGNCLKPDEEEDSRRSWDWRLTPQSAASDVQLAAAPPLGMSRLPFNLEQDVLPWCGDEMALVFAELTPHELLPVPSVALLVEVADPKLARATLRDLERTFTHLPFGTITDGFVDVRYGGQTYRSLAQPFLEIVSPSYWVDDDIVVISTTRALLQQIVDTRRVGKRHLLNDDSFEPFNDFVPADAQALAFADQRRLQRAMEQIVQLPRSWGIWGRDLARLVRLMDEVSVLFEVFPSSAFYIQRTSDAITLDAWMLESH